MSSHAPSSLFQRLIYRIYRRSSALGHFFKHRVRPAGLLVILTVPAAWLLLGEHNNLPLFQLRAMTLVVLGLCALWIFFRKANIQIKRELPRLATAGETIHYRVNVINTGRTTLTGAAALLDLPPDNRPSLPLFIRSREPDEEKRNLFDRTFAYYRWLWLQEKLTRFTTETSPPLPRTPAGQSTSLNLTLTPKQRGVILLNDLRVCLPDPFGLFQRCRKINSPTDKLIVLPHRYRIPPLDLPGQARFQLGGEAASSTIGQSGDFTSVREYRPGDPLNHIHWKSWARTGKAIVKEYEDVFFPRYGLVLDTFAPAEDADLFEEAVSVAASFAASIDTRETLLDLMFIRDEAFVFSAGRGEERIDKMLEVLAGVSCEPHSDFEALQALVLRYRDELSACICIFTGWSEARRDTVTRLLQAGVELHILSICYNLEDANHLHQQFPCPAPIHFLRAGNIEKDLHSRT